MSIKNLLFRQLVDKILSHSVELISVDKAHQEHSNFMFLDAREKSEYDVSHIEKAIHVGYKDFDIMSLDSISKNKPIIVYCSVGYRSEKIAEILLKNGFQDIRNLYGGIFEWANNSLTLVNTEGTTSAIHPYNSTWKVWINKD